MKIKYRNFRFSEATLELITTCAQIVEEYEDQGFSLTLRQLYYALVSRDIIPNKQSEYKRLGGVVNDARLAGMISWTMIEDRTRNLETISEWTTPGEAVQSMAEWYHVDLWKDQPIRPEVWIEKDALVGVIEPTCQQFDVDYFSCRGYTSQSEMWRAAMRLRDYIRAGQKPIILHLGDHDPSGKDMSRDIHDRLKLFLRGQEIHLERIALNMDQIRQYNPPPNPAKFTDSRCDKYVKEFGRSSWELDALEPRVIADLITDWLNSLMKRSKFRNRVQLKKDGQAQLEELSNRWDEISKSL